MKPLIAPRVNNNGNTAKHMVDMLRRVMDDLRLVETSLREASEITHGRNFQTCDDPELERKIACDAWMERRNVINEMLRDFMELAIDIQEQAQGKLYR
jgi:hypothetical protein